MLAFQDDLKIPIKETGLSVIQRIKEVNEHVNAVSSFHSEIPGEHIVNVICDCFTFKLPKELNFFLGNKSCNLPTSPFPSSEQ